MPSKRAARLKREKQKRYELPKAKTPLVPNEFAAERRGMGIFLRQTTGFRLALALYNDPIARDETIRSLRGELREQGVCVLTLDLGEAAQECTLLSCVEETVKNANLSSGEKLAVMVINLEGRVDYTPELSQPTGPGTTFLETANLHRELYPNTCPGPLVLWMTELLERAVVSHAPDLWHWRSHLFDLRTRFFTQSYGELKGSFLEIGNDDRRRHPEDRIRRLEEELAAYRKISSSNDQGRVLNSLGMARLDGGDARGARRDFEAALKIARHLGKRQTEGAVLSNLGLTYAALKDSQKAVEIYKRALNIARKFGDRRNEGNAVNNLGITYKDLGEVGTAITYYEQRRVIAQEIGDIDGEGSALGNLGNAYTMLGDFQRAIDYHLRALVIARKLGNPSYKGLTLNNLGTAYVALGDVHKAVNFFQQALDIVQSSGNKRGEANVLWNSALAFMRLGNHEVAIRFGKQAVSIMDAIGHPDAPAIRSILAEWIENI